MGDFLRVPVGLGTSLKFVAFCLTSEVERAQSDSATPESPALACTICHNLVLRSNTFDSISCLEAKSHPPCQFRISDADGGRLLLSVELSDCDAPPKGENQLSESVELSRWT